MFVHFSEIFYQPERVRYPTPSLRFWPWHWKLEMAVGSDIREGALFEDCWELLVPNCHLEIPFRSFRREYWLLPAGSCLPGNWKSALKITQHIKDEEASSSPHSTPALAEAWVMAGAPASAQPALGGGGIPLTSNYQHFFYVGGHFLAKDSPLLSMPGWQHLC